MDSIKSLIQFLQWIAAIAAFIAAFLWWRSAAVKLPDFTKIAGYDTSLDDVAPVERWARDTGLYSRWAAFFAGISAVASGALLLLQSC